MSGLSVDYRTLTTGRVSVDFKERERMYNMMMKEPVLTLLLAIFFFINQSGAFAHSDLFPSPFIRKVSEADVEIGTKETRLHAPTYCQGDIDFSDVDCIFSDMDGTLLRSNHRVSPRTINSIKSLRAKGKHFFPATGRNRQSFGSVIDKQFLQMYGDNIERVPGVFSQGLVVYGMDGEKIHEESLDFPLIAEIENYLKEHQLPYVGYSGDRLFTASWGKFIEEIS